MRLHTPQHVRLWRRMLQQSGLRPFRQYQRRTFAARAWGQCATLPNGSDQVLRWSWFSLTGASAYDAKINDLWQVLFQSRGERFRTEKAFRRFGQMFAGRKRVEEVLSKRACPSVRPSPCSPPPDLVFFLGQEGPQQEATSAATSAMDCSGPLSKLLKKRTPSQSVEPVVVDVDVELSTAPAAGADLSEDIVRERRWLENWQEWEREHQ